MAVTPSDVRHIAKLARLSLTESEEASMTDELNSILKYVEKLDELDTTNVDPLSTIGDRVNVLREDIPQPSLPTSEALKNAPDSQDRFFKVPKVISGQGS